MKIIVNNRERIITCNKLDYIDVLKLCDIDTSNSKRTIPTITTVVKLERKVVSEILTKNESLTLHEGMIISSIG